MRIFTTIKCQFGKKFELFPFALKSIRNFRSLRSTNRGTFTSIQVKSEAKPYGSLFKSFGFTVFFSGATLVGATICEYERFRAQTYKAINYFRHPKIQRKGIRQELRIWWNNLADGERLFAYICFANVLVFLAWRVPAFNSAMMRYFCHGPTSNTTWAMVFSTFSHQSLLHLAANMVVLYSFSPTVVAILGKEQFMAFYLTSGVVSSFTSVFFRTATGRIIPSLGASGAILGIIGFFCMQFPDGKLGLIFLPFYTFSASIALKTLMGIDLAGCILGWRFFDHAAHLGGALMGIFWHEWGNEHIWRKRGPIIEAWDKVRRSDH